MQQVCEIGINNGEGVGGVGGTPYIINERPQAEATASMMRARLLLIMCLAISLDADRIVEVRNCNNNGSTGSTTSGLTTPATYPTLSHTASLASMARSDGSHVRTLECVDSEAEQRAHSIKRVTHIQHVIHT